MIEINICGVSFQVRIVEYMLRGLEIILIGQKLISLEKDGYYLTHVCVKT